RRVPTSLVRRRQRGPLPPRLARAENKARAPFAKTANRSEGANRASRSRCHRGGGTTHPSDWCCRQGSEDVSPPVADTSRLLENGCTAVGGRERNPCHRSRTGRSKSARRPAPRQVRCPQGPRRRSPSRVLVWCRLVPSERR